MRRKTILIGLAILAAVIAAGGIYLLLGGGQRPVELRGYVGGEKIGLLDDPEVQRVLERDYKLTLDYAKAGSLDMVTADHESRDFLFPSSQTALEYYQQLYGAPDRSQIVFNTPIVLYTHRPILEAFLDAGMVTEEDGDLISTMDVFKYKATQEDVDWLYSSDEEFAETVPNVTWIETSMTELDGESVRELLTINEDELYTRSYLYLSGAYLYEIRFDCHESYRNDMDPIYDEVLHSCALTIDPVSIPPSPAPDDLPEGLAWVEKPNVVTDNWGFRSITGILENTSSVPYETLFIEFNLYDASGNQIGTASDLLSNLQAGGTWKFEAGILNEDAVRFELVSVSFQS